MHPDERAAVASVIDDAGRDRSPLHFETRIVRPDGALRHIQVRAEYILGQGAVAGLVGISQDITERKEAQRQETRQREFLQQIFDHIPVMVVLLDAAGRPLVANREFTAVLGWDVASLEDRDFMASVYPDRDERRRALDFVRSATGRCRVHRPTNM